MVNSREQAAREAGSEWVCKYYFNENQYAFDLLSNEEDNDDNLILPMAMLVKAFIAGCEHEAKVITERLEKWAKDHWIPSPTANDSFWQNDLIRSLLALINPPKEESE